MSLTTPVLISGCGEATEGHVHVDNGSEEMMVVFVDGKQRARIGPGRCRELNLPLGDHEFLVKQNDEVIYQQTHKIDLGDRPFRAPRYVLNPDRSNRYCRVTVVYRDDDRSGQELADLITMISNSTSEDVAEPAETEAEGSDPVKRPTRAETRLIARQYWTIRKRLVPVSDDPFFQVEDLGNLFAPLPTVVYSQTSGDQKRQSLTRVPEVLHEFLRDAGKVKSPSKEQLERLKVAEDVTLSYVPFR